MIKWLKKLFTNAFTSYIAGRYVLGISESDWHNYTSVGSIGQSLDGGVVASTAGLMPAPTGFMTVVSGTNAITGIPIPYSTFAGMICYLPTGVFTWTAATNIALAGTAVVGKALYFTYLPSTAKWYPSYIA